MFRSTLKDKKDLLLAGLFIVSVPAPSEVSVPAPSKARVPAPSKARVPAPSKARVERIGHENLELKGR